MTGVTYLEGKINLNSGNFFESSINKCKCCVHKNVGMRLFCAMLSLLQQPLRSVCLGMTRLLWLGHGSGLDWSGPGHVQLTMCYCYATASLLPNGSGL